MTRPGYAREYHTQNYYKSYGSPSGRDPEPASPLPAMNNRKASRKGEPKGEKEERKPPTPKAQYRPFNPRKARASTAAMKRESYTCKKVRLPHCVYGEAMMHEVHGRPQVVTQGGPAGQGREQEQQGKVISSLFICSFCAALIIELLMHPWLS